MKMKISLKAAHQLAKTFEGDYRACLALAMIQLWAEAKAPKAIKKSITIYANIQAVAETEKAVQAWVASGYGESKQWFPKSQLVDLGNGRYGASRWIWEVKGGSNKKHMRFAA
jgi:hypothetical protein